MLWHKRVAFLLLTYWFLVVLMRGVNETYHEVLFNQRALKEFDLNVPLKHPNFGFPPCIIDEDSRLICGGWPTEQDH